MFVFFAPPIRQGLFSQITPPHERLCVTVILNEVKNLKDYAYLVSGTKRPLLRHRALHSGQ